MKIGFLGPRGTFSEEACREYSKTSDNIIEFRSILDTIFALDENQIDECIVPIENSLQGGVTDTIDALIEKENIKVKKEILLPIRQNLMSNKNCNLGEITKVLSHPQAIAQCTNYIKNNLKNAIVVPVESTALAAKIVSESKEVCACIGNIACTEEYKLNLIERNIQDNDSNKTKFWVLTKKENEEIELNKMSMIFSADDKPGALYDILGIFKKYDINLTKIESRPAKTVLGEYIFLIDISIKNVSVDEAISEIIKNGMYVRILGKY